MTKATHLQRPDRRDLPLYPLAEAASYLRIAPTTLRAWVRGRAVRGSQFIEPLIRVPDESGFLSYNNLAECHVLSVTRFHHKVKLRRIRAAITTLNRMEPSAHPLLSKRFETDGVDIFSSELGNEVINLSRGGQWVFSDLVKTFLDRIEFDERRLPIRLYPFTGEDLTENRKIIVMMPGVSSGRPVVAKVGVLASIIARRAQAGESIENLAEDYGISTAAVEEAVSFQKALRAA